MDPRAGDPLLRSPRKFFAGVLEQLIAYARHARRLTRLQPDGKTLAFHLGKAAKRNKEAAADLKGPDLPPAASQVWTWFLELSEGRQHGAHAMQPLSYAEISAWAALTGRAPKPMEVNWLRQLDAIWLSPKDTDATDDFSGHA